MTVCHTCLRHL